MFHVNARTGAQLVNVYVAMKEILAYNIVGVATNVEML